MASVDLRGYSYVLEPVRRRRVWQFDAALARLGDLNRQISEWKEKHRSLDAECLKQSDSTTQAWSARTDPGSHARQLGYLAALQQSKFDAHQEIARLTRLLPQARQDCIAQQQKLDLLDRHRVATLHSYAMDQHRKSGAQADQDWAARQLHPTTGGDLA